MVPFLFIAPAGAGWGPREKASSRMNTAGLHGMSGSAQGDRHTDRFPPGSPDDGYSRQSAAVRTLETGAENSNSHRFLEVLVRCGHLSRLRYCNVSGPASSAADAAPRPAPRSVPASPPSSRHPSPARFDRVEHLVGGFFRRAGSSLSLHSSIESSTTHHLSRDTPEILNSMSPGDTGGRWTALRVANTDLRGQKTEESLRGMVMAVRGC